MLANGDIKMYLGNIKRVSCIIHYMNQIAISRNDIWVIVHKACAITIFFYASLLCKMIALFVLQTTVWIAQPNWS